MKIFNHQNADLGYTDLESITNTDGKRQYLTPEGNSYPSITTILSSKGNPAIEAWKKRVGEEEANRISTQASTRGTAVHNIFEKYGLSAFQRRPNRVLNVFRTEFTL